ncbi:MAG: DUF1264 domain-containing protein [Thermoleophilia bacterium]
MGRALLAAGAHLLQHRGPLGAFGVYVAGLHCGRDDPSLQMEAHHWCAQSNDDLLQCVVFDGNTEEANLIGIEYIVSERLYATLPEEERGLWHPHNYEVLSGQLVAPGLPPAAEHALMRVLVNSYGKTWHTWHTGTHATGPGHPLPFGPAMPMWSFNRDGEADPAIERDFLAGMGIDLARSRARRADLLEHARPQQGVDRLADAFPLGTPIPGVIEAG